MEKICQVGDIAILETLIGSTQTVVLAVALNEDANHVITITVHHGECLINPYKLTLQLKGVPNAIARTTFRFGIQ